MSFFMAGGELGRSLGPLLLGFGVTQWGLDGLWRLMFFGWLATFILYFRLKDVSARSKKKNDEPGSQFLKTFARVFVPLFLVMVFRNFVVNGLSLDCIGNKKSVKYKMSVSVDKEDMGRDYIREISKDSAFISEFHGITLGSLYSNPANLCRLL
jgi:hypothetical protein